MDNIQHNPVVTRLSNDLLQARKDGDLQKKQILQSVLARITNAEAVPVKDGALATMRTGVGSTEAKRRTLSGDEIHALIQQEIDELNQALEEMSSYPDNPYAAELRNNVALVSQYL